MRDDVTPFVIAPWGEQNDPEDDCLMVFGLARV